MLKFYNNLSRKNKIVSIFLSIPLGGFIGFVVGLVSTTFIPICCNDAGCHSCLRFRGLMGYQAAALIGFLGGLFLLPIIYLLVILYLRNKRISIS